MLNGLKLKRWNNSRIGLFLFFVRALWKSQPQTNLNTNIHVVSHQGTMQVVHAFLAQLREPSCEATSETIVVAAYLPAPPSFCVLWFVVICTTAQPHAAFRACPRHDVRQRCCRHGVKECCFTVHCKGEVTDVHCCLRKFYGSGRVIITLIKWQNCYNMLALEEKCIAGRWKK